jgi:plastocyanin
LTSAGRNWPGTTLVLVAALGISSQLGCSSEIARPAATPATLDISAGDDQIGPAGQALRDSLVVIVRDAAGDPVSGVAVSWEVTAGGGSVSPTSGSTLANGMARARYVLGLAGSNSVTATVANLPPVRFDAIGQIQGAVAMGSRTIGPLTDSVLGTMTELEQPLNVMVVNHLGVPVAGVVVSWTASGGGSVSAPTSVTGAGGEAMIEYTFGAEARSGYGATAAVSGLVGSPVVWDLKAQPGNPVALQKTGGDGLVVQAGAQVVHTVTVRDAHGNGTQGVGIQWASTAGGGTILPTQNFSGTNGTAEATRTLGSALGDQTATASAPTLPGSPVVTFNTMSARHVVRVVDNQFVPNAVVTSVGDSVAWQWQGTTTMHTIYFAAVAGAPADEPGRTAGVVWRVFRVAGTFPYQCTIHAGMTGTVTVAP